MNLNIHIGPSTICKLECEMKTVSEMLIRYYKIIKEPQKNKYLIMGDIVHRILQITLKYKISELEYLYFYENPENKPLEEIIKIVFYEVTDQIGSSLEFRIENKDFKYNSQLLDKILSKEIPNLFPNLSILTKLALIIDNEKKQLISCLLGDEININFKFMNNLLVYGKIDLVLFKDNELILVELKTGEKYTHNETQLKIYGNIIKMIDPLINIKLQLWYPKLSSKPSHITLNEDFKEKSMIESSIQKTMDIISKKKKISSLNKNKSKCSDYFCENCKEYLSMIESILRPGSILSFMK